MVVATHDERLVPLADRLVNLTSRREMESRPPETTELAAGEILFEQGDPGELVYVVESGKIDLVRTRQDGTEELLITVTPDGYFGELAPMFGLQRAAWHGRARRRRSPATRCATFGPVTRGASASCSPARWTPPRATPETERRSARGQVSTGSRSGSSTRYSAAEFSHRMRRRVAAG